MTVTRVHRFRGHDPWEHLAREERLLDTLPEGESALLLYVNQPCIVMGKHQNPLREVRLAEAFSRGVPLVRRASGGGTVWHDEGNLNWSWIGPKESYDRDRVSQKVASSLGSLGRSVVVGEKGDLFFEGRKVSGAAYLVRRDRVLHHGTLLCLARLADLHGVLGPTGTMIDWVGVSSRPSPVTNLDLDVEIVADALPLAFGGRDILPSEGHGDERFEASVGGRARELEADSWLWDQTPPFTWTGETALGVITAVVRNGVVESARDDRNPNLSKIVGKRFFTPEFFNYIQTREVV